MIFTIVVEPCSENSRRSTKFGVGYMLFKILNEMTNNMRSINISQ